MQREEKDRTKTGRDGREEKQSEEKRRQEMTKKGELRKLTNMYGLSLPRGGPGRAAAG